VVPGGVKPVAGGAHREQINKITALLDGSTIYGITAAENAVLREGSGGRMLLSGAPSDPAAPASAVGNNNNNNNNNNNTLPPTVPGTRKFVLGYPTNNIEPGVAALNILMLREHNRYARELETGSMLGATDDELFDSARQRVIALLQQITIREYLPRVTGRPLPPFDARPAADAAAEANKPGIYSAFVTAAFRYGHSGQVGIFSLANHDGSMHSDPPVPLRDVVLDMSVILRYGIEPVLVGQAGNPERAFDPRIVKDLLDVTYNSAWAPLDLGALNIQRGRDHALPDFNTARELLGLGRLASIDALRPECARELRTLYAGLPSATSIIDNLDLFLGGLCEVPADDGRAPMGPTFRAIIEAQFQLLRYGDPLWFERAGSPFAGHTQSLSGLVAANVPTATGFPSSGFAVRDATGNGNGDANTSKRGVASVLGGDLTIEFEVEFDSASDPTPASGGVLRITATSKRDTWIGIGFPQTASSKMPGADIVIGHVKADGTAVVEDRHATAFATPSLDTEAGGTDDLSDTSFVFVDGGGEVKNTLKFTRRLDTGGGETDNVVGSDGSLIMIYALGVTRTLAQHVVTSAGVVTASLEPGDGCIEDTAAEGITATLYLHGIGMIVGWLVGMPLGVYYARYCKTSSANWVAIHELSLELGAGSGFPLILSAAVNSSNSFTTYHTTAAYVFVAFVIFQIGMGNHLDLGIAKESYSHAYRLWRVMHRTNGWLVFGMAMAQIITGMYAIRATSYYFYAMYGWLFFLFLLFGHAEWLRQRPVGNRADMYKVNAKDAGALAALGDSHGLPVISRDALASAVKAGKAWLILDGGIVDVRAFALHHPGGSQILLKAVGTDVTQAFHGKRRPKHAHTKEAQRKALQLRIGIYAEADRQDTASVNSGEPRDESILNLASGRITGFDLDPRDDASGKRILYLELKFDPETLATLVPGQHLNIRVTARNTDELVVVRKLTPISVNQSQGKIVFVVRLLSDGRLSNLLRGAKIGDSLSASVLRPLGSGITIPSSATRVVFVAGGTGVAGFLFYLEQWIGVAMRGAALPAQRKRSTHKFFNTDDGGKIGAASRARRARRSISRDDDTDIDDDDDENNIPVGTLEVGSHVPVLLATFDRDEVCAKALVDGYVDSSDGKLRTVAYLSQPPRSWNGNRGRISESVAFQLLGGRNTVDNESFAVFLAGPPEFENAAFDAFVACGLRPSEVKSLSHENIDTRAWESAIGKVRSVVGMRGGLKKRIKEPPRLYDTTTEDRADSDR
jgi:cytochrome b involved in lipid metabolism